MPTSSTTHHPAVAILQHRGLSYDDVARHVGLTGGSLRLVLCGHHAATPRVRRLVAAYLDLPEQVCFLPADGDAARELVE